MAKKRQLSPSFDKWTPTDAKVTFPPRLDVTVQNVLDHLAALAFHDKRNAVLPNGNPKPLRELDDVTAMALAGVEIAPNGWIRYRFADKSVALRMLGEYLRLFNPDASDVKLLDDLLQEYRKRYLALVGGKAGGATRV